MNGEVCCILGVCCPPLSEQQYEALASELVKGAGCEAAHARTVAEWLLKHFDLAPAGSLSALKADIAKMARVKQK